MGVQPGNPIVGGTDLRIPAIESPNYVPGVSGWVINQDGSAEFSNLNIRGTFTGLTLIGGSFQGINFVINDQGIFLYEAGPGGGPPPPPPPPPAAPVPYLIGHGQFGSANQVIPVSTPTQAGDLIHVAANAAATLGEHVTGITDTQNNSYTPQGASAAQVPTSVWTASGATNALGTADKITVTYSGTSSQKCATACGVRGLPASPVDVSVPAAANSVNPQVTSGPVAEASELVLAVFGTGFAGGVPSLGTGITLIDTEENNSSQYLTVGYTYLTSTGGITVGASLAAAAPWSAIVTTLKES
jgi:hypothetical protein